MITRIESQLILLITFGIGIGTGFLGARAFHPGRMHDGFSMGNHSNGEHHGPHFQPGAMMEKHIMDIAKPTDDQKIKMAPVIAKYHYLLDSSFTEHRKKFHGILDSLDSELKNILDQSQMEKLKVSRRHPPIKEDHPGLQIPMPYGDSEYEKGAPSARHGGNP